MADIGSLLRDRLDRALREPDEVAGQSAADALAEAEAQYGRPAMDALLEAGDADAIALEALADGLTRDHVGVFLHQLHHAGGDRGASVPPALLARFRVER